MGGRDYRQLCRRGVPQAKRRVKERERAREIYNRRERASQEREEGSIREREGL